MQGELGEKFNIYVIQISISYTSRGLQKFNRRER